MKDKIKVGLVEDQFLFREGMKAILSSWQNIEIVFESPDGYTVMEKLRHNVVIPDVMLVDLSLPASGAVQCTGLDVTRVLSMHYPAIKILILSIHEEESFINQSIEAGAHGYLVKDCNPQEVYEAVCAVYIKGSYINEKTLKAIQQNQHKKNKPQSLSVPQITRREEEILQLICQQYTAEEIGEKLFISTKTVNGHRNNLLQKTGSRNVTGLVLYAIRNSVVSIVN